MIRYVLFLLVAGCAKADIAPSHKGMMFDRTGMWAFYTGGDGLEGDVLSSGTYWTGIYDAVHTVECGVQTNREPFTSLTQDGVQFSLDVYIRFHANCQDTNVKTLLTTISTPKGVVTGEQLYVTFMRGPLGEAVRENVSPFVANDLNTNRTAILDGIRTTFLSMLAATSTLVVVDELNLSNMDFPDELDAANNSRAEQAVLRDKAIAERDRIDAEIDTAKKRAELALEEGRVEAARINEIGRALADNPAYLQYSLQKDLPAIYEKAGATGNLVITAPSPTVIVQK